MSRLLEFHRLRGRDSEGRMLSEIWEWDEDGLENCHDFIQWMFPLAEPSSVNADAPLVTKEEELAFRREPELETARKRSLSVFLQFLGLSMAEDGNVVRGENFAVRAGVWKYSNHNWLRITRMLKSLRLLGLEKEAGAVWLCVKELHDQDGLVSEHSFKFWEDAMK
jgi:opioid growth factor receptor-like protein